MAATTLGNSILVSSLPQTTRTCLQNSTNAELPDMAATVIRGYEQEINQHEEKIRQLRGYITNVKEICNSRAPINMLPPEILMQILHNVKVQVWARTIGHIELKQVCRFWCNFINRSPRFWMDVLTPDYPTLFTRHNNRIPLVFAAFERTRSVGGLAFSLHGQFIPTLASRPSYVSRISTIWLDCSSCSGAAFQPFLELDIPQLEKLTLWRYCYETPRLEPASDRKSDCHFPRLSYLRTNCVEFALQWVTPAMRTLLLGDLLRGDESRHIVPKRCQCRLGPLNEVFKALGRCPDLEELAIDYCLPATAVASHGVHLPPAPTDLERLRRLHLAGELDVVRSVLENLTFPSTAQVSLGGGEKYHRLSDLLPRRQPLAAIAQVRSLTICIRVISPRIEKHFFSAFGENEQGDQQLSLHCRAPEGVQPWHAFDNFDLMVFFRSVVGCFSPSHITRLSLVDGCTGSASIRGKKEWSWLFQSLPSVTELVLNVQPHGVLDAYSALASPGALVRLQSLRDIYYVAEDGYHPKMSKALVSMLERRASQGLRLRSVTFTPYLPSGRTMRSRPAHPALSGDQLARAEAVTEELYVEAVQVEEG